MSTLLKLPFWVGLATAVFFLGAREALRWLWDWATLIPFIDWSFLWK